MPGDSRFPGILPFVRCFSRNPHFAFHSAFRKSFYLFPLSRSASSRNFQAAFFRPFKVPLLLTPPQRPFAPKPSYPRMSPGCTGKCPGNGFRLYWYIAARPSRRSGLGPEKEDAREASFPGYNYEKVIWLTVAGFCCLQV